MNRHEGDQESRSGWTPERLGHLASRAYQERYMVHATKDSYIIPEELLMGAFNVVETGQKNRIGTRLIEECRAAALSWRSHELHYGGYRIRRSDSG